MSKYLRKFQDQAAYNQATLDLPCVSLIKDGMSLMYDPKPNGPEMIDLGLSVKWAKNNIGATCGDTAESWYGGYYAWGETETKLDYSEETYKFGTASPFSKYDKDGKTVLEAVDDIATQTYGSNYRMPTKAELEELKALPNQWVTNYNGVSGLNGRVFTGTNGNTLFIPANSANYDAGSYCYLWSCSLDSDDPRAAWLLFFNSGSIGLYYSKRYIGFSVRAVQHVSNS